MVISKISMKRSDSNKFCNFLSGSKYKHKREVNLCIPTWDIFRHKNTLKKDVRKFLIDDLRIFIQCLQDDNHDVLIMGDFNKAIEQLMVRYLNYLKKNAMIFLTTQLGQQNLQGTPEERKEWIFSLERRELCYHWSKVDTKNLEPDYTETTDPIILISTKSSYLDAVTYDQIKMIRDTYTQTIQRW